MMTTMMMTMIIVTVNKLGLTHFFYFIIYY